MKKHLIMALLAGIPIASNASFLTRDLRNLLDILEEEERQIEERRAKRLEEERKAIESAPKVEFEPQKDGQLMSVSNLETKEATVTYDYNGVRVNFDGLEIGIQQLQYANSTEKYLLIDTKQEAKSASEKENRSFNAYARAMSRQTLALDRGLDFGKAQAKYDASKKLFTLFIPHKETKTLAVEMVS